MRARLDVYCIVPAMSRPFAKYEGLGNDFIVLESARWPAASRTPELARALCDRHRGIGADGVLWIDPRQDGSVTLVILNADGSRPEMCGNGVRCVAVHELLAGRVAVGGTVPVASDAGLRNATVCAADGIDGAMVEVDMGHVRVTLEAVSLAGGARAYVVDVGNPHAVIFDAVPPEHTMDVVRAAEGRRDVWPHGVNVEFAQRSGDDAGARVRVHERGVGWTEACGTGACAVAAAMMVERGLERGARWIDLDGGRLEISVTPDADGALRARMRGPARRVFVGEVPGSVG